MPAQNRAISGCPGLFSANPPHQGTILEEPAGSGRLDNCPVPRRNSGAGGGTNVFARIGRMGRHRARLRRDVYPNGGGEVSAVVKHRGRYAG